MKKMPPMKAATTFIERHFPHSSIAILSGSIVRNDANESSDLDLIIVDFSTERAYRSTHFELGWLIEVFVYPDYKIPFEQDTLSGIPFLTRMCKEGVFIKDDGKGIDIQQEAIRIFNAGPLPWSQGQIDRQRYLISDQLDDLSTVQDEAEKLFIVHKLIDLVQEWILRVNKQWVGYGKWGIRSLREFDPELANEFIEAITTFHQTGDTANLTSFVEKLLKPYGGLLLEGYNEGI